MLVLFETPAGYALFKVKDETKVASAEDIQAHFKDKDSASSVLKLKAFQQFNDTVEAVTAATAMVEGKMDKSLKKFLTKQVVKKELKDKIIVGDTNLMTAINEKLEVKAVAKPSKYGELFRGIRSQLEGLLEGGITDQQLKAMRLGLSHSLSRYKLKFSPDKVDTMIIQAIGLLDELDKEINTYAMRVKEWYGWHYPEMAKIVSDTIGYSRVVLKVGVRENFRTTDLSSIIEDDTVEQNVKETAEISMGTELAEMDIVNIQSLASEVVKMAEYRTELNAYLFNRMQAIAPNLTCMVGELVGARLIAHAGSLMNLAKQPASTVQILGAEKALFRALKTKHATPKYGLIYHASLIGQATPKNKGKISRILAAKAALAIRVDAMGETDEATIGRDMRVAVEQRIRQLEGGAAHLPLSSSGPDKYDAGAAKAASSKSFNSGSDVVGLSNGDDKEEEKKKKKKRKKSEDADDAEPDADEPKKKKKKKKEKAAEDTGEDEEPKKKKKKKKKDE